MRTLPHALSWMPHAACRVPHRCHFHFYCHFWPLKQFRSRSRTISIAHTPTDDFTIKHTCVLIYTIYNHIHMYNRTRLESESEAETDISSCIRDPFISISGPTLTLCWDAPTALPTQSIFSTSIFPFQFYGFQFAFRILLPPLCLTLWDLVVAVFIGLPSNAAFFDFPHFHHSFA